MSSSVSQVIRARPRDVGGFVVRRTLPAPDRRLVGPFIFFDHMGPTDGTQAVDVRPHPHIGLATVTYLFEGEILHRDNLGSTQPIRPGDVNWMIAGRGIVHSERTPQDRRGVRQHGIQSWVALPTAEEEREPSFHHHPGESLPRARQPGAELVVIAGAAFGQRSPVEALSPLFYVDAVLSPGATLTLPEDYEERAAYVALGSVAADGEAFEPGALIVFAPGTTSTVRAHAPSRVMLLGGARLEGSRHIYWNFVSSSKERIERAKEDWKGARFPKVPGDDKELIPLPED